MANANEQHIDKGISFPFRFGSSGGVRESKLTHTDYSRIIESIEQIIFTFKKERVMLAKAGSTLREYVFELDGDETTMSLMQHEMTKAIEEQEPRVLVNSVKVQVLDSDEGSIMVFLDLHIIQFVKDVELQLETTLPSELIGGI